MRKLTMILAAAALLFAFAGTDIASAAAGPEVTFSGVFRWRGLTGDDLDGNDRAHDSRQSFDHLTRPRWTFKSQGGKIWGIYELDVDDGGFGESTSKDGVVVNRWLVDFMVPGTTLRFRYGRTDWRDPSTEIIGGAGRNRQDGYGLYGKLYGPLTLNLWTSKTNEGVTAASDRDLYFGSIAWKAAPAITITPWIAWEHDNQGCTTGDTNTQCGSVATPAAATTADFDIYWFAVNAKAKFGIASLNTTLIFQDGDVEYGRGSGLSDVDIEAWAALVRLWLSFGKLKVGFYGHFFSGDDDTTSTTGRTGVQGDNELERFSAPRGNGGASTARLDGPQLYTRRRYSTFGSGYFRENRAGGGSGGANGNGAHIYEVLAKYKLTKSLELAGNISLIRSAASRADIDANSDGDTVDAGDATYDSAKDIGTEVDISLKYQIYKELFTRLTFAYLFNGDYGKVATSAGVASSGRDFEDTWAVFSEFRYTFKGKTLK